MTPEQEVLYALQWNVPRSELTTAAQLEYDRLRPAWGRREARPTAAEVEAAQLAWEKEHPPAHEQRSSTPVAEHGSNALPVNSDQVRDARFPEGSGYARLEVDDLVNRIAAELDAGRPAGPLIQNALFRKGSRRAGYQWKAVDLFLEQLLATERGLQEPGAAGREFGPQPGTRLSVVRTGIGRRELRTTEQQTTVVSVRDNWLGWGMGMTLSAGGKTFTWKLVPASSWPRIAGTISSYRPGDPGHMWLYYGQADRTPKKDPGLRQLLDETGTPILFTGGITSSQANGYIKFPGHRWLRFPVQGRRRADAIMTAMDQAGNEVARYRLHGRTVQITVHQELTDELTLAIALSAPWLRSRFDKSQ